MLAQKWLVDPSAAHIHRHAVLHGAITLSHTADAAIGPGHLLSYAEKVLVPKGREIYVEGEENDGLFLLYRGQVDLIRTQPPAFINNVYPGAFFNENVLYAPSGAGTLTSAVAAEDSLLLRVSKMRMAEMQHADPHKAHQLVLCIFKQVLQPNTRAVCHGHPQARSSPD